ncbi:unnamed protein product [Rotaria sordida]|uniref:Uncharacterized protein n=1 Tax=Rotaria sordida TaxID=392033 RepID=A0A815NU84_9BILA|nr:unnamed protein product [Rotaria sordida]CAF1636444.1 unnamed protein product [Rotaria sordida]
MQNNALGENNEWYTVPIHTRIQDSAALAAVGGDDSAGLAAIRAEFTNMEEIKIMVYTGRYVSRYTCLEKKTIAIHIVAFLLSLIFGIALASAVR